MTRRLHPEMADMLRDGGCKVELPPGFATRSTWDSGFEVRGIIGHHTATGRNWADGHVYFLLRDGRRDLRGPLAQWGVERDGTWVGVAAGRANHDGFGRWGNDAIGVEVYNAGNGEIYPEAQMESWLTGTAALLAGYGLDENFWLGHRESASHKIDPFGIDCGWFRTELARKLSTAPTPTFPKDDDMYLIWFTGPKGAHAYLLVAGEARHITTREELNMLSIHGVPWLGSDDKAKASAVEPFWRSLKVVDGPYAPER